MGRAAHGSCFAHAWQGTVMNCHACRRQVQPADSRRLLKDSDARQEQGSEKGARRSGLWNWPDDAIAKKAICGSLFLSSQGTRLPICQGCREGLEQDAMAGKVSLSWGASALERSFQGRYVLFRAIPFVRRMELASTSHCVMLSMDVVMPPFWAQPVSRWCFPPALLR